MNIDNKTTALVVTDPQNDFLSEDGAASALVGDSVRENNTIMVSPHKVYGPQNNDLALQLRKHGISRVLTTQEAADALR
jgi:nicotinamidase-related amidase